MPVLLALSGLGWAAAHAVAHHTVMAGGSMPASGPSAYLGYLPTSLALCFALALPLAAGTVLGRRWKRTSARSLWLFGLVPVLGFVGHALVQPVGGTGPATSLVPVVLVGLAVQIPFALAAVGLARRVLWLAESVAHMLIRPSEARSPRPAERYPRPRASRVPRLRLDPAHGQRGPPPLAA